MSGLILSFDRAGGIYTAAGSNRVHDIGWTTFNEARASQYDFASEDDIDEDASDPTRRGNFDLADASQMAMETQMSLRAQALEADKSRKALQTAQDASGGSKRVRRCLMYFRRRKGA